MIGLDFQNSRYGARLCAEHQPQRVYPPQTLRLVLWTQPRSGQNANCWRRYADH